MNENVAEMIGLFLGDGCLSRYFSKYNKKWISVLLFTGNLQNDKEYYESILRPIILKFFKTKGYMRYRVDDNTIRYFIFNKNLINYLIEIGFRFGSKTNSCRIPDSIFNDKRLRIACVRGIFNADGTVYRRYRKKYKNQPRFYGNYAVIQFKMKSKVLIEQIRYILQNDDFVVNKISKVENYFLIRITNQKYVNRFFKEIAINHPYHLTRYADIKNS